MIPDELPKLDDKTILILQAGEMNTGAFDPFQELCERRRKRMHGYISMVPSVCGQPLLKL
jgi:hypothetical protein